MARGRPRPQPTGALARRPHCGYQAAARGRAAAAGAGARAPINRPVVVCASMKRLSGLAIALLVALSAVAQKRAFTIEDFYRVKTLSELSLSHDGKSLVFTVAAPDLPRAKRSQRIWIIDAPGA